MQPLKQDEIEKIFSNFVLKKPEFLKASDETQLAYYSFIPHKPKAIIIFYHGARGWSNAIYQHMAQETCTQHNLGVYLIDVRGHGNSHGPRGDAPSSGHVWDDIDNVLNFVTTKHPGLPVFIAGHSAGSGLILNYLAKGKEPKVDGYIFLAPLLGDDSGTVKKNVDTSKQLISKPNILALITHAISGGILFAHTPAVFFNSKDWTEKPDPLMLSYYTCSMVMAMFPRNTKKTLSKITKPYALFIGQDDERFDAEKVMAYQKYLKNKNKLAARIIPKADHRSIILEASALFEEAWLEFSNQKNKILETDNLILRNFVMEDDKLLLEIMADGGMPHLAQFGPLDINYTQGFLNRMLESYKNNGFGIWAVIKKDTNNLIGWCGIHKVKINEMEEKPELAYRIYKNLWGKGLATEAATAVRDYAFNVLKLPEIVSCISHNNERSMRVAEKVGLTYWKEGIFKGQSCRIYKIDSIKD